MKKKRHKVALITCNVQAVTGCCQKEKPTILCVCTENQGGRTRGAMAPPLFLEEKISNSDVIEIMTSSLLNVAHPRFFWVSPPWFLQMLFAIQKVLNGTDMLMGL